MTVARAGISKTASSKFNSGSIRDQFGEIEDTEAYVSPGPGAYNHFAVSGGRKFIS
jgi:hypothetical protein